jgi:SAM-dependent methyltransferase
LPEENTSPSPYHGLGRREGSALGDGNVDGRLDLMDQLRPLEGKRVLDVGAGNGAYTLRIVERFDSAVGIDIEPDRLEDFRAAAAGRPVEVLQCSATDTPFADGEFDAVTAIETMEHLREYLPGTMKESARVLRRGGTFYLTTPNRWWPLEQHGFTFRGRSRPGWQFPFLTWIPAVHRRFSPNDAFTPRRLDSLIEPHGFRRTGLAYMFPPLDGHPALRRRVQPFLRFLGRTPLRRFAQTLVMTYERV